MNKFLKQATNKYLKSLVHPVRKTNHPPRNVNFRQCDGLHFCRYWKAAVAQRCMLHTVGYDNGSTSKNSQTIALPYKLIPGPTPLPLIGNKLLFTSLGGYPFERFWSTCWKLYHEYGRIVRISKLTSKLDLVFVFHPDDTRQLFQNEGPLPVRPPIEILEYYRKSRPQWFTSSGLVPGNGPEWRRLRSAVQTLLKRNIVSKYREKQAEVCLDFVSHIQRQYPLSGRGQQGHNINDLLPLLFRYTLEAVGVVSLGSRIGCFSAEGDHPNESYAIISANEDSLTVLGESLFKLPLYKIFPSKNFLRLAHAQDAIANIMAEQLHQHKRSRKINPDEFAEEQPFLDSLMDQSNLTKNDIFLLLVEVFQGGIDATATTLAFCIHYLSRNDEIQSLLYEEVKDVNPAIHNLQGLRYLRAVLQETFRMRPSASANGRILCQDAVFSGYHVPAGTLVSSPPVIACHDPKVFPDPYEFKPERWLSKQRRKEPSATASFPGISDAQSSQTGSMIHPYSVVPFGHGARMCPGRRIAEQEIYLLLIHLVQRFKMEQITIQEVRQVMRLNMMPDAPINVKFIPRF